MRRAILAAVLLLFAAVPARADVRIEWKFKADDHFYAEEVTMLKLSLDGAGVKSDSDVETTILYAFTVKKADKEETILEEKIESVKCGKGDTGGRLEKALDSLRGTTFTITLNREMQVTKLEGFESALKKMNLGDESTMKLLQPAFDEDAVRRGASLLFGTFPAKPVADGARWERLQALGLGAAGVLDLKTLYTYKGKSKDGEEIWTETTADYQPPKQTTGDVKFVRSDVSSRVVRGQLTFDADAGRLLREETGFQLNGTLTLEIKGKEQSVQVQVEQSRKLRVSDKPPKE